MKKTLPITLLLVMVLFLSCDKIYEKKTYYKTIGEGYVYDGTNNIPLKGATVTIYSCFPDYGWFGPETAEETFTTDTNGYYQIRFIKRTHNEKVGKYLFGVGRGPILDPTPPYWVRDVTGAPFPDHALYPEDIKDKKVITFDTVKFYRKD